MDYQIPQRNPCCSVLLEYDKQFYIQEQGMDQYLGAEFL